MTRFFVAGVDDDRDVAEAVYTTLRERSSVAMGSTPKLRRIFKLDCRFEGCDCEIEVGKPLPRGGGMVAAILDHGREQAFAVYTTGCGDVPVRVTRPVYTVTVFG